MNIYYFETLASINRGVFVIKINFLAIENFESCTIACTPYILMYAYSRMHIQQYDNRILLLAFHKGAYSTELIFGPFQSQS